MDTGGQCIRWSVKSKCATPRKPPRQTFPPSHPSCSPSAVADDHPLHWQRLTALIFALDVVRQLGDFTLEAGLAPNVEPEGHDGDTIDHAGRDETVVIRFIPVLLKDRTRGARCSSRDGHGRPSFALPRERITSSRRRHRGLRARRLRPATVARLVWRPWGFDPQPSDPYQSLSIELRRGLERLVCWLRRGEDLTSDRLNRQRLAGGCFSHSATLQTATGGGSGFDPTGLRPTVFKTGLTTRTSPREPPRRLGPEVTGLRA